MISQNSLDSSRGMESAPHYFVGLLQCKTVKGIDGDEKGALRMNVNMI